MTNAKTLRAPARAAPKTDSANCALAHSRSRNLPSQAQKRALRHNFRKRGSMVQSLTGPNGKRKHRACFANPAQGRRSQIAYKLGHGIRGISPVLLKVESEQAWREHYEGIYRSVNPGSEFEADLAYLLAWQLWRIGRLIRHETALTNEQIYEPPESLLDSFSRSTLTKEAILDAIARLESENRNGNSPNAEGSKNSLLTRCRALARGEADVMFEPSEVREILTLVLEQIRWNSEEQNNAKSDDDDADSDDDRQDEELAIEERPWAAGEIAEQIQILSDAADLNWREELALAIQSLEHVDKEHLEQIDEARRHVLRNLVLDERTVNRLALYERHIMAQFKSTYSLLERARAYRLGMPVPPPVSVDLTVSKAHDANGV